MLLLPLMLCQTGPTKDDFTELTLLQKGSLTLSSKDGELGEAYYSFTSTNIGKYIAARLSHMSKAELDIYFFSEFEHIRRSGRTFDGYQKMCTMTDKFECGLQGSSSSAGSHLFWIIIKLKNEGEIYDGSILFFNEENEIPLTLHQMWGIKRFYGLEQLYFTFTIPDDVSDAYEIIVINRIPSRKNKVALYIYESGVPVKVDEKDQIDTYRYETNQAGRYRLQVIGDGVDDDSDVTVLFQKEDPEINRATKMELGTKYTAVGYEYRYFNYYVKLDGMQKNEENVATITLSRNLFGGAVRSINSMVVAIDDESLIEDNYFPVGDADSQFQVLPEYNNEQIIHLYFYNNQATTNNAYLLITIFFVPDALTLPTQIDVAVSKKLEVYDLTLTPQTEWTFYINRQEEVPISMRFTFDPFERATYVFYFSNNATVRYYEGTFLDFDDYNIYTHTESLFAFKNDQRDHRIEELSINFFGPGIGQFMRIQKLVSQVDYYEVRNEKSFTVTHTNTSVPYYYIADNEFTTIKYVHFEEIYGNCEVYYKTSIKDQRDPIFPTADYKVDPTLIEVGGVADIFSINCHYPGKFIMHFFGTQNEVMNELNSKRWLMIPTNNYGCITVDMEASSINIMTYSPYNGDIEVCRKESGATSWTYTMKGGSLAINSVSFKKGDSLCMKAMDGRQTIASASFILDSQFKNVTGNLTLLTDLYVIYYLPQGTDYSEVRFSLDGINSDFRYALVKQKCNDTSCDRYAPYPSKSWIEDMINQEYLMSDVYQFRLDNPYDKKGSSSDYKYYLALELYNYDETQFTKYNITIRVMNKQNYTIVPPKTIAFIQEDYDTNTTMEFVGLEIPSEYTTKYVLIAQKTAMQFNQYVMQRSYYTNYGFYNVSMKYNVFYMNNLGVDTQLTAFFQATVPDDYNCVEMSYQMLYQGQTFNESDILRFNDLYLEIAYTPATDMLEWTPVEGAVKYVIFIATAEFVDIDKCKN